MVGGTVLGVRVITSPAVWSISPPMCRRRSPSVMTPCSRPCSSQTPTQPKRFSVIISRVSCIEVVGDTKGSSASVCIRSPTVRSIAPMRPPGCSRRNSLAVKPRRSSSATARASPRAICRVVEVVGAETSAVASGASDSSRATVEARPSVLLAWPVMPISGMENRLA